MKCHSVILGLAILFSHLGECFSDSEELKQLDKANITLYSIKGRVMIENGMNRIGFRKHLLWQMVASIIDT